MSNQHKRVRKQKRASERNIVRRGAIVATLVVLAGVAVWLLGSRLPVTHEPAQGAPPPQLTPTGRASKFQALLGRWQRPDGGYVLQITNADENGKLDAAYFNPKPIHVSRAQALREDSALEVFVELRDANYPGSTYTLRHDPAGDQLKGIYYQAALGQQFEVIFERLK